MASDDLQTVEKSDKLWDLLLILQSSITEKGTFGTLCSILI